MGEIDMKTLTPLEQLLQKLKRIEKNVLQFIEDTKFENQMKDVENKLRNHYENAR